mmetsp:Transcript_65840/g.183429  ORF Transcript_65840/g.183429 Transcript_65840/m.183429 type:complete len:208 (-) Transcript_65840:269-892(-)
MASQISASSMRRQTISLLEEEHSSNTAPRASAVVRVSQPLLSGWTESTTPCASTTCGQSGEAKRAFAGCCKAAATSLAAPATRPAAASLAKSAAEVTPLLCIQPMAKGANWTRACGNASKRNGHVTVAALCVPSAPARRLSPRSPAVWMRVCAVTNAWRRVAASWVALETLSTSAALSKLRPRSSKPRFASNASSNVLGEQPWWPSA